MLSAALYARVRISYYKCTRDRGGSAHPAFPAPSDWRGRRLLVKLGQIVRRDREPISGVIVRLVRDCALGRTTQYPRDANDRIEKPRRTGSPPPRGCQPRGGSGERPPPNLRSFTGYPSSRHCERSDLSAEALAKAEAI